MVKVNTTAGAVFSTGGLRRASFILHADADNSDTINISGTDAAVVQDFEELQPGQSISFENYQGFVYAVAESGTQNLYIPFVTWEREGIIKS